MIENYKLIHKIAYSFHISTGIDFNELVNEAYLIYLEKAGKCRYNKDTTTFIYHVIENHLINFVKKEQKYQNLNIPLYKEICYDNFETGNVLELGKKASELAEFIYEHEDLFQFDWNQKDNKWIVRNYLRKNEGWTKHKINTAIRELRENLNS